MWGGVDSARLTGVRAVRSRLARCDPRLGFFVLNWVQLGPGAILGDFELCASMVAVVIQTLSSCHQNAFEVPKIGVRIILAAHALCGSLNLYQ